MPDVPEWAWVSGAGAGVRGRRPVNHMARSRDWITHILGGPTKKSEVHTSRNGWQVRASTEKETTRRGYHSDYKLPQLEVAGGGAYSLPHHTHHHLSSSHRGYTTWPGPDSGVPTLPHWHWAQLKIRSREDDCHLLIDCARMNEALSSCLHKLAAAPRK